MSAFESKVSLDRAQVFIGGALLLSLIALAIIMNQVATNSTDDKEYISLAGEQRVLSQSIVKDAVEASSANVEAFKNLKQGRNAFDQILTKLMEGNPETGLPPTPTALTEDLDGVTVLWGEFKQNADTILEAEGTIRMLSEFVGAVNETMPTLLAVSDEVVSIMIESGANASQVYVAARQLMLIPRISVNANKVLQGGQGAASAADRFGRDAALFGRVLDAMLKGNPKMNIRRVRDPDARDKLSEVSELFETVHDLVGRILDQTPTLFEAQKASNNMVQKSKKLLDLTTNLMNAFTRLEDERPVSGFLGTVVGTVALVLLLVLGWNIVGTTRSRLMETADTNRRNQDAIMRLLDEIGDLASGDLTAQATVTEDITGAIADAINYAIDALRRLVSTINETTVQVSSAAQETQATAMHLAEASDHQAEQITAASAAINEMAISIEHVSANSLESSNVAHKSVDIAKKGAQAVQDTIRGMDEIREQIQETAKRIKRLGESSQEIGDLASGDLTAQATVTEDITGAIA
ncbi:methyl-accepting chemotaxis protein, partial [Kaarinaea lacus]